MFRAGGSSSGGAGAGAVSTGGSCGAALRSLFRQLLRPLKAKSAKVWDEVSKAISPGLDVLEVLFSLSLQEFTPTRYDELAEAAAKLIRADCVEVFMMSPQGSGPLELAGCHGSGGTASKDASVPAHVTRTFQEGGTYQREHCLCVPVGWGAGGRHGVLCCSRHSVGPPFEEMHVVMLNCMALLCSSCVSVLSPEDSDAKSNKSVAVSQSPSSFERSARSEAASVKIMRALASGDGDLEGLLGDACDAMEQCLNCDKVAVYLYDEKVGKLNPCLPRGSQCFAGSGGISSMSLATMSSTSSMGSRSKLATRKASFTKTRCGTLISYGEVVSVEPGVGVAGRSFAMRGTIRGVVGEDTLSMATPLMGKNGRAFGVIQAVGNCWNRGFNINDEELLVELASQVSFVVSNSQKLLKMRQECNLLEAIFESMSNGVLTADKDGRVLKMNAVAQRALGLEDSEELGSRTVQELFQESPEVCDAFSSVLQNGSAELLLDHRMASRSAPTGSIDVKITVAPLVQLDRTLRVYGMQEVSKCESMRTRLESEMQRGVTTLECGSELLRVVDLVLVRLRAPDGKVLVELVRAEPDAGSSCEGLPTDLSEGGPGGHGAGCGSGSCGAAGGGDSDAKEFAAVVADEAAAPEEGTSAFGPAVSATSSKRFSLVSSCPSMYAGDLQIKGLIGTKKFPRESDVDAAKRLLAGLPENLRDRVVLKENSFEYLEEKKESRTLRPIPTRYNKIFFEATLMPHGGFAAVPNSSGSVGSDGCSTCCDSRRSSIADCLATGDHNEEPLPWQYRWVDVAQLQRLGHAVGGLPAQFLQMTCDEDCQAMQMQQRADEEMGGVVFVLEDVSREKKVLGLMSKYMDQKLAKKLLAEDENALGGRIVDATMLFSDIRSFTTMTEILGPAETVTMLNEYFEEMVQCVSGCGGIVDKFIGDAIMAVWGAPFAAEDDADRAVEAALAMLERLRELNNRRRAAGKKELHIGIGINSDQVVSGNIGSTQRMEYTVVGDGVNLGSRLEAATKEYGVCILVSDSTRMRLRRPRRMREIDVLVVKGKTEPSPVWEPLGPNVSEEGLRSFEHGVRLYRAGKFGEATRGFKRALDKMPDDGPSQVYVRRCEELLRKPPKEWDGVWRMKSK